MVNATNKHKATEIMLYNGCSDLPIFNFYEVLGGDFSALRLDYDYYNQNQEIPKEAAKRWDEIYNEYCFITENNTALNYYNLICELNYLETRFFVVSNLINRLPFIINKETSDLFIKELQKWRYKIDPKKPFIDEFERIQMQIKGSVNEIELKRSEITNIQKGMNDDEFEGLTKQIIYLEEILNRDEIDPKKKTVVKWVEMWKMANKKMKPRKKVS